MTLLNTVIQSPSKGSRSQPEPEVRPMKPTMQDYPLTLDQLFRRAERQFGQKQIISASPDGVSVTTYAYWAQRTRRLIGGLRGLHLRQGARVGTFAWNSSRHLEISFAGPLSGLVFHPLNVRLPAEQLTYVINDAADDVIFVDRSLLPRLAPHLHMLTTVRQIVVMNDEPSAPNVDPDLPVELVVTDYEELLAAAGNTEIQADDENAAASVCYTSGTTGNPKGVVYSHRSLWLHAMALLQADATAISENDTILPLVPFFHANAWDLGYAAVAAGANLVLPGSDNSGAAIAGLISDHRVTLATAVPAVWSRVLPELRTRDASSLRMLCSGGSAVPERLTYLCRELTGKPMMQVWGMTETGAFASMARTRPHIDAADPEAQKQVTSSQGIPIAGVDFRIVREDTLEELPWDGVASGELQCRGPWVTARYHGEPGGTTVSTSDHWFRTGDAASIDPDGYIRLRDRLKDLIKSGGEWIPTVELEGVLQSHPAVDSVAVIGVPSLRWDERPIAVVALSKDGSVSPGELMDWLRPRVAKLWLPDEIRLVPELPVTSVGKIDKKELRNCFGQETRP
ncbi:long-chain-fatty-acid--CoA ligase [Arthrobacter sp. MI7-26]|uniref:long-chain-fatty-acid--CoA ligase n=1 Tax=Arthrobacter sp. MI7-26 TaxID=2993653 RepID=UPI002248F7D2|nr:long-chain-fatty-acid--CoA ligase [Arthrobacter sp. MI7-26]MCX2746843.1 long-chain-fatty-acid--CoA ligase [Arthrobacter sp. MI7-26]